MMRRASASASSRPISARACPAVSRPSCTIARTPSGSFKSRSVLATWLRLLPMISESCSWL